MAEEKSPLPQKSKITSQQLEKRIGKTLKQLEFQWRTPKVEDTTKKESWIYHYIARAVKYIAEIIKSIVDKIIDFFKSKMPSNPAEKLSGFKLFLMNTWLVLKYLIPLLLVIFIAFVLWRKFKHRKLNTNQDVSSTDRRPDLRKEDVVADELEEHEWLKLSAELLDKGEFRLALRALYLACICALAQRKLLLVKRYKTDYEYLRELRRRAHTFPEAILVFENNVGIFQRIWYGNYPVDREILDKYMEDSKVLFSAKEEESDQNEE